MERTMLIGRFLFAMTVYMRFYLKKLTMEESKMSDENECEVEWDLDYDFNCDGFLFNHDDDGEEESVL